MNGGFQLACTDCARPQFAVVRLTGGSPSQVIHVTVQYAELGPNSPSELRTIHPPLWFLHMTYHRDEASLIVAEQLANSRCLWGYLLLIQQKATANLVSLLQDQATSQSSSAI